MIKLKKKIYALKNKDLINKWSKESRVRNPEKMKARSIAKSKIKIPKGEKCQTCKIKLAVERHHEDYSKPLEVVFLCKSCHSKLNKRGDW